MAERKGTVHLSLGILLFLVLGVGGAIAGRLDAQAQTQAHTRAPLLASANPINATHSTKPRQAQLLASTHYTPTSPHASYPLGCALDWGVVPSPNPSNSLIRLYSVGVVSANDVWAVGYFVPTGGTSQTLVEHWDGTSWSIVPSQNVGHSNELNGIATVSANDVWAIGDYSSGSGGGTLVEHWDGSSWSVVPSPAPGLNSVLYEAVVASANDVWAVGTYFDGSMYRTLVEHWNSTAWSIVDSPNRSPDQFNALGDVAVASANDVWAVGSSSDTLTSPLKTLVEHWDGTSWSIIPSPDPGNSEFLGVGVASANDVWAVGDYNNGTSHTLVEHWDGTSWSLIPSPSPSTVLNQLYTLGVVSANDVWAVGYYHSGSGNEQALLEHWDGGQWLVVQNPTPPSPAISLYSVAVVSANDIWAVGYYRDSNSTYHTLVEHYAPQCSSPTTTPMATNTAVPTATATVTTTATAIVLPPLEYASIEREVRCP